MVIRLLTNTPRRAWPLAVTTLLVYASAPLFAIAHYGEMLRKGAYPTNADSIGIPILFPLLIVVIVTGLIDAWHPGPRRDLRSGQAAWCAIERGTAADHRPNRV